MVNQIGANLSSQRAEDAADAVADHMRRFWDPRMRAQLLTQWEMGAQG